MKKNEQDRELTEIEKIDPETFRLALKYPGKVDPSPELREKIFNVAQEKLRTEVQLKSHSSLSKVKSFVVFPLNSNLIYASVFLLVVGLSLVIAYMHNKTTGDIATNSVLKNVNKEKENNDISKNPDGSDIHFGEELEKEVIPTNKADEDINHKKKAETAKRIERKEQKDILGNYQITHNHHKDVITVEDVSRSNGLQDFSLVDIEEFYVDSFGKEKESEELRQAFIGSLKDAKFRLLDATEATIQTKYGLLRKKDSFIQIINPNNDLVLWENPIDLIEGSYSEVANKVIEKLLKDIRGTK